MSIDFQALFECLAEGLCILELASDGATELRDYRLVWVNSSFGHQTGLAADQVTGRTWRELFGESGQFALGKMIGGNRPGDASTVEVQLGPRDRWFHMSASWTRPDQCALLLFDVTERREARAKLRESEDLFAAAFASNAAAIVVTRLDDGLVLDVNETWLTMTGESREALIGRSARFMWPSAEEAREFVEALRQQRRLLGWEQEFRKRSGEPFVVQISAQLLKIKGEIVVLSTLVDITDRKRADMALQELAESLERRVEQRTVELASARDAADAANRAKSAFLANMSHEIRTPLNAIVGLSRLLRRTALTTEQKDGLDRIDLASVHLLSLLNDILDISKIESGRMQLESTNFHLQAVLDNVKSIIGEQAQAKGLTIDLDADAVPDWLCGDPTRLRQALFNYASNAVKFTERGAISVRATLLEEHGDELLLRFEVQDTGIGVPADQLSRVFHAFEQGDTSTTRRYGGTGLGLAITERLAHQMGGEVGVSSEPGRGSTFWFTARLGRGRGEALPAAPKAPSGAEEADPERTLRQEYAGMSLLVVEDNPVNRLVVRELLLGVGLSIEIAENGRDAVAMAGRKIYDLVLMDVQMPILDGLQATRAIRAFAGWESTPILALTANAFEQERETCLAAGMNGVLIKPINPATLYAELLKWLPKR